MKKRSILLIAVLASLIPFEASAGDLDVVVDKDGVTHVRVDMPAGNPRQIQRTLEAVGTLELSQACADALRRGIPCNVSTASGPIRSRASAGGGLMGFGLPYGYGPSPFNTGDPMRDQANLYQVSHPPVLSREQATLIYAEGFLDQMEAEQRERGEMQGQTVLIHQIAADQQALAVEIESVREQSEQTAAATAATAERVDQVEGQVSATAADLRRAKDETVRALEIIIGAGKKKRSNP